ncbi:MAG: HPr(Ser) kinase/phosphatase [Spirochaetota bacterium]
MFGVDNNTAKKEGVTIIKLVKLININSRIDIKVLSHTEKGMNNKVYSAGINRPGLSLTGFTKYFAYRRIQLLGRGEIAYLEKLDAEDSYHLCNDFFAHNVPCCVVSYNMKAPEKFKELCEHHNIPILSSSLSSSRLVNLLIKLLDDIFAPTIILHGTLIEIYGVGILLQGKSGVGKSEAALELIERGNRLIADDLVKVKRMDFDILRGEGGDIIKHHMEIRGIGIIDIQKLYGVSAIKTSMNIDLIIYLEEWDTSKEYDRLGLDEHTSTILDIKVPYLLIPVKPGRNIPVIIETAARNHRLKDMGYNSASEFNKKLIELISK